ncbi:hypothetical protein ART_0190 [Arthrobacter sp. PAMC 25486]|nr:hypothetical protein [Arthrobacter sp. PAMC 25486]AIX99788.1 hypothetical protein ART_0190 [Arthrobacter sp. PAMC 25486]
MESNIFLDGIGIVSHFGMLAQNGEPSGLVAKENLGMAKARSD